MFLSGSTHAPFLLFTIQWVSDQDSLLKNGHYYNRHDGKWNNSHKSAHVRETVSAQ